MLQAETLRSTAELERQLPRVATTAQDQFQTMHSGALKSALKVGSSMERGLSRIGTTSIAGAQSASQQFQDDTLEVGTAMEQDISRVALKSQRDVLDVGATLQRSISQLARNALAVPAKPAEVPRLLPKQVEGGGEKFDSSFQDDNGLNKIALDHRVYGVEVSDQGIAGGVTLHCEKDGREEDDLSLTDEVTVDGNSAEEEVNVKSGSVKLCLTPGQEDLEEDALAMFASRANGGVAEYSTEMNDSTEFADAEVQRNPCITAPRPDEPDADVTTESADTLVLVETRSVAESNEDDLAEEKADAIERVGGMGQADCVPANSSDALVLIASAGADSVAESSEEEVVEEEADAVESVNGADVGSFESVETAKPKEHNEDSEVLQLQPESFSAPQDDNATKNAVPSHEGIKVNPRLPTKGELRGEETGMEIILHDDEITLGPIIEGIISDDNNIKADIAQVETSEEAVGICLAGSTDARVEREDADVCVEEDSSTLHPLVDTIIDDEDNTIKEIQHDFDINAGVHPLIDSVAACMSAPCGWSRVKSTIDEDERHKEIGGDCEVNAARVDKSEVIVGTDPTTDSEAITDDVRPEPEDTDGCEPEAAFSDKSIAQGEVVSVGSDGSAAARESFDGKQIDREAEEEAADAGTFTAPVESSAVHPLVDSVAACMSAPCGWSRVKSTIDEDESHKEIGGDCEVNAAHVDKSEVIVGTDPTTDSEAITDDVRPEPEDTDGCEPEAAFSDKSIAQGEVVSVGSDGSAAARESFDGKQIDREAEEEAADAGTSTAPVESSAVHPLIDSVAACMSAPCGWSRVKSTIDEDESHKEIGGDCEVNAAHVDKSEVIVGTDPTTDSSEAITDDVRPEPEDTDGCEPEAAFSDKSIAQGEVVSVGSDGSAAARESFDGKQIDREAEEEAADAGTFTVPVESSAVHPLVDSVAACMSAPCGWSRVKSTIDEDESHKEIGGDCEVNAAHVDKSEVIVGTDPTTDSSEAITDDVRPEPEDTDGCEPEAAFSDKSIAQGEVVSVGSDGSAAARESFDGKQIDREAEEEAADAGTFTAPVESSAVHTDEKVTPAQVDKSEVGADLATEKEADVDDVRTELKEALSVDRDATEDTSESFDAKRINCGEATDEAVDAVAITLCVDSSAMHALSEAVTACVSTPCGWSRAESTENENESSKVMPVGLDCEAVAAQVDSCDEAVGAKPVNDNGADTDHTSIRTEVENADTSEPEGTAEEKLVVNKAPTVDELTSVAAGTEISLHDNKITVGPVTEDETQLEKCTESASPEVRDTDELRDLLASECQDRTQTSESHDNNSETSTDDNSGDMDIEVAYASGSCGGADFKILSEVAAVASF